MLLSLACSIWTQLESLASQKYKSDTTCQTDPEQIIIVRAHLVPTLVRVPLLRCLAPGRKSASGASDEQSDGSELSLSVYTSLALVVLLPSLFSDLLLFWMSWFTLKLSCVPEAIFQTTHLQGLIKANMSSVTCTRHTVSTRAEKWVTT